MGIMKEIYMEMVNRNFKGTPEEFFKVYIKELNKKQEKLEENDRHILQRNKRLEN